MHEPVKLGDIVKAHEVGIKWGGSYMWHACDICGTPAWRRIYADTSPKSRVCRPCNMAKVRHLASNANHRRVGALHPRWKGGRKKTQHGYIQVILREGHPFWDMRLENTYILEHRLIMAQHLGRSLTKWEIVHHINGNKEDNRIETLQLTTRQRHRGTYQDAYDDGFRQGLKSRDKALEKEIRLLRFQIQEMMRANQVRLGL